MFEIEPIHVFYISSVISAILFVEAGYMLFATNSDGRKRINRRMAASDASKVSQKQILVQLRKERGLDENGKMTMPLVWLNRLFVQAGITTGIPRAMGYWAGGSAIATLAVMFLTRSVMITLVAIPVIWLIAPLVYLRFRRNSKMNKFGKQLPEAIDLITRSLKAGHPVPVAISMVAREMPDPIGTEFGMVADEVTYGSDLVTGLMGMYERVGHGDLPLLVSAVSIQSTTGGNLREILESLSKVVRDRLKMKAKVKAISAEGRMSAIFLTAMPVILFIVLLLLMPDYYGGIWQYSQTYYGFGFLLFWLTSGNLLIMKMVSFKV
ncbi:MAG: type II secretion system F family protein [Nitratireductor sp.]|nr:type II secretion system F family protein [Nitratireductor sp.]MCB1460416.1 type II secretion system F family protein [Nitratireductor sp.]